MLRNQKSRISIAILAQASASARAWWLIWKPLAQNRPRRPAGAVKFIVRISHSVYPENSFQTALVERAVVGDERQIPYERTGLFPYLRERRCRHCRFRRQSVNLRIPIRVIVRNRMDKAVEPVGYPAVTHNDNSDAAHAGTAPVGRLEIYRSKIFHIWYPSLRLFMQRYRYNSLYPAHDKEISPPPQQVPYGGRHLPAIYRCVKRKP